MTNSSASATPFEQAEEREHVNGGLKEKKPATRAPVAEIKGFVAAFHIKSEVSRRSLAVGVALYSVLVPPHKYGVVVGCVLVNIAAGKEKARHIFINAAGCCEVVSRYAVVWAAGRQSEVRNGRGAWSVRRRCCAFFSCQQFNGFGKALAEKLHDKINGCAALALAVAIPFVSPDGQAVVPFPARSEERRVGKEARMK